VQVAALLVALALAVVAGCLVPLLWSLKKSADRFHGLLDGLLKAWDPMLKDLKEVSGNLAKVSGHLEMGVAQVSRLAEPAGQIGFGLKGLGAGLGALLGVAGGWIATLAEKLGRGLRLKQSLKQGG
jgi:hypothetical protein